MNPVVSLEGVSRRFSPSAAPAVNGLSMKILPGEIHALTGESGSGKSTLLRLIAGFELPDEGRIELAGRFVAGNSVRFVPPEKRSIGMVFQDHALFPHLTVEKNIAYGVTRHERKHRVAGMLDLVHLRPYASRYPHEISGGQAQRVALARALAPGPALLLMDEPFSSLDQRLKGKLLPEIRRIIKATGTPTLFVSHDRNEVFDLADRISIMQGGRLLQTGEPRELYEQPVSCYVAEFFGRANFFTHEGRSWMLRPEHIHGIRGEANAASGTRSGLETGAGTAVGTAGIIEARVTEVHYRGERWEYWAETRDLFDDGNLRMLNFSHYHSGGQKPWREGDRVRLAVDTGYLRELPLG